MLRHPQWDGTLFTHSAGYILSPQAGDARQGIEEGAKSKPLLHATPTLPLPSTVNPEDLLLFLQDLSNFWSPFCSLHNRHQIAQIDQVLETTPSSG